MTPTRDFTVFFPMLHIVILGSMQLSDLLATYLMYYYHWDYMQLFVCGIMMADLLVPAFLSGIVGVQHAAHGNGRCSRCCNLHKGGLGCVRMHFPVFAFSSVRCSDTQGTQADAELAEN